jgi:predicted ATP-grasp superfamily ATP-dependent carboligase
VDQHRPAALACGAHITALAVLRAFGRTGVPVYAVGPNRTTIARSRWYVPLAGARELDETVPPERLAAFLETQPFSPAVLFPCSDRWALTLASLPPSRAYVPAVASAEVVRILVDKQLFARAAARHGVAAPRVLDPSDLDVIDDDDLPRFFVKPTSSQQFADRFGVKALQIRRRAEARDTLDRLADERIDVLLQEMIPGPPTSHVFLDGYVDRAGTMRACLARRRLRMYPRPFGNSTLSVTIPLEEVRQAAEALRALFGGLGYTGLFDAEFKFDARDGRFKILEINARPWWQLELAGAAGLDVCTMAFRDALGEPLATQAEYRVGTTWVHPLPDLSAWWEGVKQGDHTGGIPVRSWFTGPNTVFSWDDPMPALDEIARFFRLLTSRRPAARVPDGEIICMSEGPASRATP